MANFNNIQNILHTQLASIADLPDIYYPNVGDEPQQGVAYIRPTWLPAATVLNDLNGEDRSTGFLQVDIYTILKKGTAPAFEIADKIREGFKNKDLSSNGMIVHIRAVSVSQAQRVESWWHCFVQIDYYTIG